MSYEQVIFELKEDIAIIRMNRPEKKNAFSPSYEQGDFGDNDPY